jgi:cytochrome c-type biogenesis protein
MGSTILAFVAGFVTILNPCVLPILPVIVGSALSESRYGPAALAMGLVLSFSSFGLLVIAFGFSLGLNEQIIRMGAAGLLIAAGLLLMVPRVQASFTMAASPLVAGGQRLLNRVSGEGFGGQFAIGALLGVVWAPCVGPTLGVAIAAASRGENLLGAFFIFLIFGAGVATSILAFAYGSRKALGARKARLQVLARYAKPAFGAALIVVGLLILSGLDKMLEAWLLGAMPMWLIEFTTRY